MKKVTNIANPDFFLIVKDAYVNGSRIVCETDNDNFDLWRSCWTIEEYCEITMQRFLITAKSQFPMVPPEWWPRLGVGDLDNVKITITKGDKHED